MNVAFLSFDFGEYCIRLAGALSRETRLLVMLPHGTGEPYLPLLGTDAEFRPFHRPRYRQAVRQLRMVGGLLRRIRSFDPDVIHLQAGHPWFNLALPLLSRYPLVVTIHDPRHHLGDRDSRRAPQWIMDFGVRRATRLIVHATAMKQMVVSELGIPGEIVHVIPHILLGDDVEQPSVAEDGRTVLFFGRIWGYKGLEYLIRAEPLITSRVSDATIVIAGRGEDFGRYRRMMVHPERFVVLNEYVSDQRRAELFRRASVVVLPYVEASQSGVIPLAYTAAKPVVATTVGGLPEMVDHGRTGFLVPPRDETSLAESIVRLLQDEELRRHMGIAGRQKIQSECSPDVVARQTLEVYRHAVGSAPAESLVEGGRRR